MNILVTGATGFLGKHLAVRLANEGHHVVGIGRNEKAGIELMKQGVHFVSASLEDKNMVLDLCVGQDYVFHCGALSSAWGQYSDFHRANAEGTLNIIEGCRQGNVKRLIYVSTPSIYFNFKENTGEMVTEDSELPSPPVNYYASTKRLAEIMIDNASKNGLPVITIRPRALFGPGDNAILPRLIRANNKSGVPLINGGNAIVDVTYVGNVVDSLILCMSSPEHTLGKKYNITNGEPMALYDILELVFKELDVEWRKKELSYKGAMFIAGVMERFHRLFIPNKEPLLTQYGVNVLANTQTLSIEAAKKDLGYQPKVSIEDGLKEFVVWWREQNDN